MANKRRDERQDKKDAEGEQQSKRHRRRNNDDADPDDKMQRANLNESNNDDDGSLPDRDADNDDDDEERERQQRRRSRPQIEEEQWLELADSDDDDDNNEPEPDNEANADNNANNGANNNPNNNNNNVVDDIPIDEARLRLANIATGRPFPGVPTDDEIDDMNAAFNLQRSGDVCRELVCVSCNRQTQNQRVTLKPTRWHSLRALSALEHLPQPVKQYYNNSTPNNGLPPGLVTAALGFVDDTGAVVAPAQATQVQLCDHCHDALKSATNDRR